MRIKKDAGRNKMQKDAIASIAKFEADSIDRLRRTNIIAAGLETRAAKHAATTSDYSNVWDSSRMAA